MPFDDMRRCIAIELLSDILEDLDGGDVNMLDSREVKNDSLESWAGVVGGGIWVNTPRTGQLNKKPQRQLRISTVKKQVLETYVPWAITERGERIRVRPLRLHLHNLDKLVRVGPDARIQRTLPHAVDKDARERFFNRNPRVGTISMVKRDVH